MATFLSPEWFAMYRAESASIEDEVLVKRDPPLNVNIQYVLKDPPAGDEVRFVLSVVNGRVSDFRLGDATEPDLTFSMPFDDWVADFKGTRQLTSQHGGNNTSWSGSSEKLFDVLAIRNSEAYRTLRQRVLMKTDFA